MKTKSKKIVKKIIFSKLSPSQKRVAIARDVLEQIRLGRYVANAGSYIDELVMKDGKERYEMYGKDIKHNFSKIKSCEVCAMGACLMSITKFENKLNFEDVGNKISDLDKEKTKELFSSLFEPSQLLMIERAFEGDYLGTTVGGNIFDLDEYDFKKQIAKCEDFFQRFNKEEGIGYDELKEQKRLNQENRMIAIMKNIIRNKGTFKL